jgi:mRNA interferase MazF
MVLSSAGAVVLVPFPFSDLSRSKLRPAVALADAGRGDWVLCQVTSNIYSNSLAVPITQNDFQSGGLRLSSYALPGKLFTANHRLITREAGILHSSAFQRVVDAVIALLKSGIGP